MKKFICAILSLMLFVACSEEITDSSVQIGGDESVTPSITLNQTSINFDEHAYTQEITFNSAMAWTAELINERADGWCSISPTSGSAGSGRINVNVTNNSSTDDRTASVIIKSGAISRTVRITQKQQDALTVTASSFEVEGTKGKIYIEVKANIDFEYTINGSAAEWITPIETRAMKTTTLGFNIAENNTMQRREGTITIHSGAFSETVTVYQKDGGEAILLSHSEYVVSDAGEDIAVEVTSNVDVEIEMPDVDWITRNVSRAVSTNTYYFTVAENTTYDQREAYITFKNTAKNITERVKVTQVQRDAIVLAKSEYEIEMEGGRIECEILANVDIQVDIPQEAQEWITHVETRALQTNYLVFEVASYDDIDSREALITLSGGDATQTITIRQLTWQNLTDNKIYYTSSDGKVVTPNENTDWGGAEIMSNTYENGQGVITFSRNLTAVGSDAFRDCDALTSITIPNSVKTIETQTFYNCSNLAEVILGESVETIGWRAFEECDALTSITIPNSVKTIDGFAFNNCSNLAEINIGTGVETIGEGAFQSCEALTSLNIPGNVKTINNYAFNNCYNLAEITLNEGLETIGECAFQYCEALTSLNIPGNVKTINNGAFAYCYNLAEITLNEGLETIGGRVFEDCSALKSLTIPQSVVEITGNPVASCNGIEAFYGKFASEDNSTLIINNEIVAIANHGDLTSYTIPNGITKIADYAFANWYNLQSITIPDSVTEIGNGAFVYCGNLQTINIPEGITIIKNSTFSSCNNLKQITLPNSLTKIEYWAFEFSGLTEITIPDNVTEIGDGAFTACNNLTSFSGKFASEDNKSLVIDNRLIAYAYSGSTEYIIPEGVTTLGSYSFAWIMEQPMATISLPNSLTTIEGDALYDCRTISEITIPENITYIGGFSMEKLSKIYCKATTPPTLGGNPFNGSQTSTHTIYVPTTSVNAYKNADGWRGYAHLIQGYDF